MKGLSYILLACSVVTLILALVTKFSVKMVAGVGPTGYLTATMVLLLFAANLALLELLKKK